MNSKVLALLLVLIFTGILLGAREVNRVQGLRQEVFKQLQEIQTLAETSKLDKARSRLHQLQQTRLFDYELAQTWFLLGYIHYRQQDYPAALDAYRQVLDGEIPLGMRQNVLRTLFQLSALEEQYDQALVYIDQLLTFSEQAVPENYFLKAQLLFQMEQLDRSMAVLEQAISLQAERGRPPLENWLLLKNAILYSRNDYRGMLLVLQQLVDLYPKDRYLLNMAAIYGELDNSERQLALMEPLYERGRLSSAQQLVSLASLYMLHDIPYKGAVLLDREIAADAIKASEQHLEMLAQAWLLAAEYEAAVAPMQKAADLVEDGNAYVRLARTLMSLRRWREAEKALLAAIEKGDLLDLGDTQLMLGMARFNQKNFRAARRSFARAGQHAGTEKLSRQWLDYLAREEEKAAILENP